MPKDHWQKAKNRSISNRALASGEYFGGEREGEQVETGLEKAATELIEQAASNPKLSKKGKKKKPKAKHDSQASVVCLGTSYFGKFYPAPTNPWINQG